MEVDRFTNWKYPDIEDGKLTKYNWIVQNLDGLSLGEFNRGNIFSRIDKIIRHD